MQASDTELARGPKGQIEWRS